MRPGGGAGKGASFERETGVKLSLWLTKGERADLFSRNVLSGGRFTRAAKASRELGDPGDLMAAHPLAFPFLAEFMVECKHHAQLKLDHFIYDAQEKSPLLKIVNLAEEQSKRVHRYWFVIAKQNMRPALLLMPRIVSKAAKEQARPQRALHYHSMHRGRIFVCKLDDFLALVPADRFLAALMPRSVGIDAPPED